MLIPATVSLLAPAAGVAAALLLIRRPRAARGRLGALRHAPTGGSSVPGRNPRWLAPLVRPVLAFVVFVQARRGRRARERRIRASVISLCDGMAAELAAGRSPEAALAASVGVLDPEFVSVLRPGLSVERARDTVPARPVAPPATLIRTGRSLVGWETGPRRRAVPVDPGRPHASALGAVAGLGVAELLEHAAARPGAEGLGLLAACWRIGVEHGGAFAAVIDGLADALRDQQAHREEIAAQLAGPRATAKLLACLPVLGLAMAAALGAHPMRFLFATPPGLGCLAVGGALDLAGLLWTSRIAESAHEHV